MLECAGLRFSRAGKDFFREREKAVSGTEWDDLHKAGWAKSHDGRSLGRGSRGGRPLLLPTHTWKKGRECRLPPQATGHTPTALWVSPVLSGAAPHTTGSQTVLCDNRDQRRRGRKQQGKDRSQQAYLESVSLGEVACPSICKQCLPQTLKLCAAVHNQSSLGSPEPTLASRLGEAGIPCQEAVG